jgi:hypothetical protein
VAAVALAFTGAGDYSLDNVVGLERFNGPGWGVLAAALGVLASWWSAGPPGAGRRRRERDRGWRHLPDRGRTSAFTLEFRT